MDLDPRIRRFLDHAAKEMAAVAEPGLPVAELRRRSDQAAASIHRRVAEPGPAVAAIRDHTIAVDGGEIRLRVYTPPGTGPFSGHVHLHGGGWWQGSIDDWVSDVQARERCAGTDTVVVTVDYRLAPEHPFPTAVFDSYAAWKWVVAEAGSLEIDRDRLSLGGASAGGNLAAAVCLLLKERGESQPVLQLLEVPACDFDLGHPSMVEYRAEFGFDAERLEPMLRMYLPDPADEQNPLAAPLLAPDLSGLAPAHILTAEFDPLRDAAEMYAARLRDAGVPVTLTRYAGQIHTSPVMTAVLEGARAWRDEVLEALLQVGLRSAAV